MMHFDFKLLLWKCVFRIEHYCNCADPDEEIGSESLHILSHVQPNLALLLFETKLIAAQ
jgi:hypothetical protein